MTIEKLKEALKTKKLILGNDRTIKGLKTGEIVQVFLAKNCHEKIRNEIKKYSTAEIIELAEDSVEIATICKRQHPIAVIGISK